MKFSVIICTNNSEKSISKTLNSLINQNYSNFEIIIIDNLSNDNTLGIISKFNFKKAKIISERDNGIYYAINKSFSYISGDIVFLLHSDDQLYDNQVFSKIYNIFKKNSIDVIYGNIKYVSKNNTTFRNWRSGKFHKHNLKKGWMPPHTSLFIKRDYLLGLGKYDTNYSISSDYDYMLRFLTDPNLKIFYCDHYLIKMMTGGMSNNSIKNILKKSLEDYRIIKKHNLEGFRTLFYKNFSKIKQFLV